MSSDIITKIGQGLRSSNKLNALEKLEQIENFDQEVAEGLIDDLDYVISSDKNAYTLLQALKHLRRISTDHPRVAIKTVGTVSALMNKTLGGLNGEDPSENRKASWATDILGAILDGTDPDTLFQIQYNDVNAIVKQGSSAQRAIGYRLLGRSATGEAVRILLGDFSHELDEVQQARDAALDEAGTIVLSSIDGRGPLAQLEAIDAFSELLQAGQIDPTLSELQTIEEGIFDRVKSADSKAREQLFSAVERLTREDRAIAESITDRALEIVATDANDRYILWELLQAVAKGAPSVVLSRGDEVATILQRADTIDTQYALDLISMAAKRHSSVPATFVDPVLKQLRADDRQTIMQAIETVEKMGFYPPPEALSSLTGGNSDIAIAASKARKRLRKNRRPPEYVEHLLKGDTEVNVFDRDSGQVFLKNRTGDGRWEGVDLGDLREGIVEETLDRLDRNENVPIVYPYYEPSDVVILTLALVLEDFDLGKQVGMYSPGSQTQWGMKSDIREELRHYALSENREEVVEATPIPELVTEAYVSDGEVKDNSDGAGEGRIVITKKTEELEEVPNLDAVVLNSTSRARLNRQESVTALEDAHPETDIVSAHSYYTRNDTEGRPRYGPPVGLDAASVLPDENLLDQVSTGDEATHVEDGDSWQLGADEVRSLRQGRDITISEIDGGSVTKLFNQLFENSMELMDTDAGGAGGLIFSRHLFFQRLPIPPQDYDDWVREKYAEGDRFVPPLIQERIEDVEQKAGVVENLQAVQPLNAAKGILDRVDDRLRERNPLYEALKDAIRTARDEGKNVAIFSASPKNALLIREVLLTNDIVSEREMGEGEISIVSPDEIRDIGVYDKLMICGPLHPEHAGFYVHPRIKQTEVLTYDRSWAKMIDRHASEYVDMLNNAIGGPDSSPFAEPTLLGDIDPEDEEREQVETSPDPIHSASGTDDTKSKDEILAEALRSVSASEYGEDSDRYERELRHYTIETSRGEQIALTNHESVLRKRATGDGGEIDWVSVDSFSVGDTLITIPNDLEEELWHAHLTDLYDDEIAAERAVETVRVWYDALNEIFDRVKEELETGGEVSDTEVYNTIYNWVSKEIDEFDRVPLTVRNWFESAREADNPVNLAQNPSLILGPRSHHDIEVIGRAFGYTKLETNARDIENTMEGFRTVNQNEGSAYRDSVRDSLNSGESTRISESVTAHEIVEITTGKPKSRQGSGDNGNSGDSEEELIERVKDLVELAPTNNSELADEWGFSSGSEVYQFLSSELSEYYIRNDEKLIVPTEKAKNLVRNQN